MGLFDRFKNPAPAPEPDKPLVWHAAGDFETASCHGRYALQHLEALRQEGRTQDFTAIMVGNEGDYRGLAENKQFANASVQEILQTAGKLNVTDWFAQRMKEASEYYNDVLGEWPGATPQGGSIGAHLDVLTRKPHPSVYLAKLPTPRAWEAPAYVGMGGWNACPGPATLSAVAKRWHEKYSAEIVSITHDVMEFTVANPPTTREDAMELAKEQYLFCGDIVDQGVGDISSLAAVLLNSKYWYFWWD